MNLPSIFPPAAVIGALSLLSLPVATSFGQTAVTTNPVGFLQVQCLGNSDTLVAIPFTRPAAFTGAVASVSGAGNNVIAFTTAPGFTSGQFVFNANGTASAVNDHFYLSIGPAAPVAVTGTLSVTQNSPTVTGTGTKFTTQLTPGDRLSINDGSNLLTFTVASVDSPTSLTLDRAFADSAATGNAVTTVTPVTTIAPSTTIKGKGTTTVVPTAKPTRLPTSTTLPAPTGTTLGGLAATFDHSPYEGRWYMVTANDTGTVTVNLNGDTLPASLANTQVSIVPFWTLNTLYPAANAGISYTPSASSNHLNTQILIPNYAASGINISSAAIYYYVNGTYNGAANVGWRSFIDSDTADHGNDYLLPDGYFTVRQDNNSPAVTQTFTGGVPTGKLVTNLATSASQPQDNPVGLNRPMGATLNSLGLSPVDGSFQSSASGNKVADQLLVYDNSTPVINRPATGIYYYVNGTYNSVPNVGWRSFIDSDTADHGADVIAAGSALTIRKAATAGAQTVSWTNSPNY